MHSNMLNKDKRNQVPKVFSYKLSCGEVWVALNVGVELTRIKTPK